jgi:hypothetical protein
MLNAKSFSPNFELIEFIRKAYIAGKRVKP